MVEFEQANIRSQPFFIIASGPLHALKRLPGFAPGRQEPFGLLARIQECLKGGIVECQSGRCAAGYRHASHHTELWPGHSSPGREEDASSPNKNVPATVDLFFLLAFCNLHVCMPVRKSARLKKPDRS